jgi:PAS domain S-box-containing protein
MKARVMQASTKPSNVMPVLDADLIESFSSDPDRALANLLSRFQRASGAVRSALYRHDGPGKLSLVAGLDYPDLRSACADALQTPPRVEVRDGASAIHITPVKSGETVSGVLALVMAPGQDGRRMAWPPALVGLLGLGLQHSRWRDEARRAALYRDTSSFLALTHYAENILRSIAAGVITIDKNGLIATWNARAEEIISIQAYQIVGKHYRKLIRLLRVDSAARDEMMRMVQLIADTGKVFTHNQLLYHPPGGAELYINLSASQLKNESGDYLGIVVVFEDITREVQMKEEVERVSKLAEAGELAANIAHELRNPLSSIKGAAQLLRNELSAEHSGQFVEFLDIIIDEVNGLNRMTTDFLEFARAAPAEMRAVDLNALLARLLQFMGAYLTEHGVKIVQTLDRKMPSVTGDRAQIEQVMKNIVINAVQAMPDGGVLTVASRYHIMLEAAEVTFGDTGAGIPIDKQEKIWTPFFTTKTKGTGLGLAIARRIVESHGGRLTLRSAPGDGSAFSIHLPINHQWAPPMRRSPAEIADQRSDQPGDVFEKTVTRK